ncbi:hypothetical protein [[Kitasatospora] papulosa]|uniref:hypothetical protein n=1 Tax=[Kitasatospora] papulosa TaxID=1464011 RepID=UPI00369DCE63
MSPTPTNLTDEQREARRTRARDLIEARLTETWPAWRRPGRKPNLALAADIALDSLGDLAAEILVDGTMMRALTIRDGVATLELAEATEMVTIFAAGMRGVLNGHGASNYVEMEMTDGKTGEGFTVTVRRRERPTPHELRQQADARADKLAAELAEARRVLGTTGQPATAPWPPAGDQRPDHELYVTLRKTGLDPAPAQQMIDTYTQTILARQGAPAVERATVLSENERTMLTYALDQAQEHIWSEDGFTDEDQAAVTSLRRLAAEAQQPTPAETDLTETADDAARRFARRLHAVERLCSGRPGYHTVTVKQVLTAMSDADEQPTPDETEEPTP